MHRMKIILPVVFFLSGVAAGQDSITVEQAVQTSTSNPSGY